MNRPTTDDRTDENEIRGWIAEAGDCRVETRPEHVDHVRHLLLDRVVIPQESVTPPDETEVTPIGIGLIRLLAVACLVGAALFAAVYFTSRPVDGWYVVAQALHDQNWIHIVTSSPDGLMEESWISPRFQILARRQRGDGPSDAGSDAEFEDIEKGIKDDYLAEQNTIFRDFNSRGGRKRPAQELEIFGQVLQLEPFKVSPIPDTEVIVDRHRDLTVGGGRPWREYSLVLRWISTKKADVKMNLRVDPTTGLPHTWTIEAEDGTFQLVLDYPRTGPSGIRGLGVPATAKRDQPPAEANHDQVLNALKVGRNRFDDYCAYAWNESPALADLHRVRRKGRKWSIEQARPRATSEDEMRRLRANPERD